MTRFNPDLAMNKLFHYIFGFLWDVITHSCPNFNDDVVKLKLKLLHGCVASHTLTWMYFYIHVVIPKLV